MEFLAELKRQQAEQPLHQPSAIESWLDRETDAFQDPVLLSEFRSNYLGGGTQNWPSRIPIWRYKYIMKDKQPVLNPGYRPERNTPLSLWLDGIKGKWWLRRAFRKLKAGPGPHHGEWLTDNLVGAPFHARVSGAIITEPLIRHEYYVRQLLSLFPSVLNDSLLVFEIGGGYGSLARLLKLLNPRIKVILTDLPERVALQHFFLSQSFPDARISVLTGRHLDLDADFILIPTWKVPLLPEKSVDLVINTHSMQEMNLKQVSYYVEQVKRITRSGFYCVNRYEKEIGTEIIKHPAERFLPEWRIVYDAPQPGYDHVREVMLVP